MAIVLEKGNQRYKTEDKALISQLKANGFLPPEEAKRLRLQREKEIKAEKTKRKPPLKPTGNENPEDK